MWSFFSYNSTLSNLVFIHSSVRRKVTKLFLRYVCVARYFDYKMRYLKLAILLKCPKEKQITSAV